MPEIPAPKGGGGVPPKDSGSRHHAPYTLHPTPYTLHPTPYTLHPSPHTLHHTPYTLHHTPCTLHPTAYSIHDTSQTSLGWKLDTLALNSPTPKRVHHRGA